jgi:hypothetical protein
VATVISGSQFWNIFGIGKHLGAAKSVGRYISERESTILQKHQQSHHDQFFMINQPSCSHVEA